VQEATAPIICVLHADTLLPDDAVAVMRRVLADPGTALAGFTPLLSGPDQVRWGTSFHNWIKTWYAPLLFRPQLFLRGARLQKMAAACKAAGKTCEIKIYPDTPHGFNADYRPSYRPEAAKDGWAKMLAWFKEHGVA
jgi:hypothetical protein